MSTYRFFAGRLIQFARLGLKRILGRAGPTFVQQVPGELAKILDRPSARGGSRLLSILRTTAQRGASSNLRAAGMGLWRNAGRKSMFGRYPFGGLAGAILNSFYFSNSGIFERIKDIFGEDPLNLRNKNPLTNYPRNLAAYDIGSHIAVGCNAVVYEARIKPEISVRGHFGKLELVEKRETEDILEDILMSTNERKQKYPLAVKMMFNYDFSSQEARIVREMGNELVPVVDKSVQSILRPDQRPMARQHENIVEIYTSFVDSIPSLPGAEDLYPSALPFELCSEGFGRSKTMFLIMKRYSMTLFEYLRQYVCPVRTGQILLGQLLEALVYLSTQKVSHRDMKSNNVLVDFDQEGTAVSVAEWISRLQILEINSYGAKNINFKNNLDEPPKLVLCDFGCCLSNGNSLELAYPHEHVDLGGNVATRPPEVINAVPGPYRSVDFSKADLWGAGTLGYEIFTKVNPFYKQMNSAKYLEEELPEISDKVPLSIRKLIRKILRRDPSRRPSVSCSANVVALSLFRVESFKDLLSQMGINLSLSSRILWLKLSEIVSLYAAETILRSDTLSTAEMQMRCTFLRRLDRGEIWEAVPYFLANENDES